MLLPCKRNTFAYALLYFIIVLLGFPDSDLIVIPLLATLIFSVYVPGFTVIISPELALSTAACIEPGDWTIISAAFPIPEINIKIKKVNNKVINLLIKIPPLSTQKIHWGLIAK